MNASALYFVAAFFSARKIQRQIPAKWLIGVAVLTLVTLGLIWLALTLLAPQGSTPPAAAAPPAYPTPAGSG